MTSKKTSRSVPSPNGEGKMMSELPYKALKDLSDRLDLLKDGKTAYWRELARLMDYNSITVETIGLHAVKPNGSPGYAILLDMSNRGISYEELVSYLKKLELFDALVQIGHKEDVRITKQPVATPVMVGQKLELECKAEGIPRPKYMWFHGKTPLTDQLSPKLVIDKVTTDHGGVYTCRASNDANFVFSQWVEVQVQSPIPRQGIVPQGLDTPMIIEHPQPQLLEVGNKLFITCQASGPGTLEYQWFRDGKELLYGVKQELVINEVQLSDQGVYVCCVKSTNGSSVLTKGAEVVVTHPQPSPFSPPVHQQPNPPHIHHPLQQHPPPHMSMGHQVPMQGVLGGDTPYPVRFHGPELSPFPGFPGPGGYPHIDPHTPVPIPRPEYQKVVPMAPNPRDDRMPYDLGPPINSTNILTPEDPVGMHFPLSNPPRDGRSSCSPPGRHQQHQTDRSQDIDDAIGQDYMIDKPCSDKVALLIGNKNYHVKTLRLNTPENDTQDLGGILRSADFKVVSLVNLTKKEMDNALDYFTQLIGPNVYAVFFFAGHGFELNNMNYMMAVDCTKEKNPTYSVCAQKVLRIMQERGAKLSIVLLDMCRVVAPQQPITDMTGVYEQPYPAQSYPGYHIYGFSCSPAEKAYEVASNGSGGEGGAGGLEGGEHDLGLVGKDNSIFVAAMKEHLQNNRGSLKDAVQTLFNATAKGVYRHRPAGVDGQWQRPEISSNLGEDLSLADPIDPNLLPQQQERRSQRWKDAHCVPDPVVVGSNYGILALRLHFEAEHTNVLIIQVEVLQGCLTETEVERMNVELILQERPVSLIIASAPQEFQSSYMSLQKSIAKKNLLHFKIPDLQKIISMDVTVHISTNYRWRDSTKDGAMWQFQSDHIFHHMVPPLYGKITAHEEEQRRRQAHQDTHAFLTPGPLPPM